MLLALSLIKIDEKKNRQKSTIYVLIIKVLPHEFMMIGLKSVAEFLEELRNFPKESEGPNGGDPT
jgi:hypothetical protein